MVLHKQVCCDNESVFYAKIVGERHVINKLSLSGKIKDKTKDKQVYDLESKLISFESTFDYSSDITD